MFQSCLKGKVCKVIQEGSIGAPRMILRCSKGLSWVSLGCFKGVLRVFRGCFKGVSGVFQGCFKGVSREYQGCSKGVSRVSVSFCFFRSIRIRDWEKISICLKYPDISNPKPVFKRFFFCKKVISFDPYLKETKSLVSSGTK